MKNQYYESETPEARYIPEFNCWWAVWPEGDTYPAVLASDLGLRFATEAECWDWIYSPYRPWNSADKWSRE